MLENHSKKHSEIIVQKKQKKVHRKKKKKPVAEPLNVEDQLNEQWDTVTSELSAAVQGRRPIPDVTPFDGASDTPFEEQKVEAVHKIREALIANEPFKALGLLRASRELWPEGDPFGAADIEPEDEFLILREIHFSNLQRSPTETNARESEENDSNEEDEEMEALPAVAEQKLDLNDVYKRYASPKVIQPCSLLLANYRNNKPQTNACLIKLLHRIAWNCKMHALFFQSTIFLTFQKIFHDPDIKHDPLIKEFYRFSKFIVQKFVAAVEKNDKIFVELLFWKGPREAYELEEGYGTSKNTNNNKGWTEDEEEELKYLFEENKDICIEGQDVADIILANLNPRNKTKQQIISALKRLGLIQNVKDLKPEKRKEWQESEIIELQNLFEDYKNSDDVMSNILDKLSIKRSRKLVVDKLLELNLIRDKKELRKKNSKHRKQKSDSDEDEDESDDNDDDQEIHSNRRNSESSGDEDEIIFFKNLEAERLADDNESPHSDSGNHTEVKVSDKPKNNKKVKNKKQVWEEQEVMELTTIFQENCQSDNILHILKESLSVKRSKQEIIEKLLQVGLIKDKKEVKKGAKSEKHKKHSLNLPKHNYNTDENSDSDMENSEFNKRKEKVTGKKKLKRNILSDSSDEDISPSSTLKDSQKNENGKKIKKLKGKEPKAWNEEDIIELNRLFMEHKNSDDIIANILLNFTEKRTKKSVIEKMLEIGLIQNKSEIKKRYVSKTSLQKIKPKRKKESELWEEQEIIELNQLYQKYRDSDDIVTDILDGLTVKRSKQDVIRKMLDIRLIQVKKEIRKKKVKKMKDKSLEMSSSVLSESSDDESVPLSNLKSNNDSSNVIDTMQSNAETSVEKTVPISLNNGNLNYDKVANEENFVEETEDSRVANKENELIPRGNKRKRLQVISDDSSDDESVFKNEIFLDDSVNQSTSNAFVNLEEYSPTKKQKKIHVLEDSDDSS